MRVDPHFPARRDARLPWRLALGVLVVVLAGAAVLALTFAAQAQTATTVTGADLWSPLAPVIGTLLVGLAIAAVDRVLAWLRARTGLKLELDARHRDALHSAIRTGIGIGIEKVGGMVAPLTIDARSAVLAQALVWAANSVPDALRHFGITLEDALLAAQRSGDAVRVAVETPTAIAARPEAPVGRNPITGSRPADMLLGLGLGKLHEELARGLGGLLPGLAPALAGGVVDTSRPLLR